MAIFFAQCEAGRKTGYALIPVAVWEESTPLESKLKKLKAFS